VQALLFSSSKAFMASVAPHIPVPRLPIRPPHAGDSLDTIAFGEWLRKARERSGVTLEQVARETKIRPLHLDALEHGRLAELPAGAYRRGETVAYAKAIGMDPKEALQHLEEALRGSQVSAPRDPAVAVSSVQPQARRHSTLMSVLVLAVSVVGLIVWTRTATPSDRGAATEAAQPGSQADAAPAAQAPPMTASPSRPASDLPVRTETPQDPAGTAGALGLAATPSTPLDSGESTILTDPPGARVTVNGIGRGATPLALSGLSAGALRIRVTKDGHTAQERDLQFTGRSTTVTIPLPERPR
jgi:cytoskeleton protein RodZ